MKSKCIAALLLLVSLSSFAQEKKPQPYSFGIGYGLTFLSGGNYYPNQNLNLSVWFPKNIEVTFPLTFSYNASKSNQFDSTYTYTNSGYRFIDRTMSSQNKNFVFSISPGLLYHFPIKSNLDVYAGFSVPISINTDLLYSTVNETKSVDYLSRYSISLKYKPTITASGQITFGCNYFFYKNLSLGAKASIALNFNKSTNTLYTKTTTIENSGNDNPVQNYSSITETATPRYTNSSQSIGFNGGGGFYLNYYFGMKSSKKEVPIN